MGDFGYHPRWLEDKDKKPKPWWIRLGLWFQKNYKDGILTLKTWKFGGPK